MWTERQLVDHVAEVEDAVVEMRPHAELAVPVAPRRDVEVALHLVALERAVDAARVQRVVGARLRRLAELAAAFAHVPEHVADVRIFLLRPPPLLAVLVEGVVALLPAVAALFMRALCPHLPRRVVSGQEVAGHDAIHGRVLNVDVQVVAWHPYHDVEV